MFGGGTLFYSLHGSLLYLEDNIFLYLLQGHVQKRKHTCRFWSKRVVHIMYALSTFCMWRINLQTYHKWHVQYATPYCNDRTKSTEKREKIPRTSSACHEISVQGAILFSSKGVIPSSGLPLENRI